MFTRSQAELILFTPEEGGRKNLPMFSGYRGAFFFDVESESGYDGIISVVDCPFHLSDRILIIEVSFLHPEYLEGILAVGATFKLKEGRRAIAEGKITKILS